MNALRTLGIASIVAGSFSLVACSGGGIESKSPEERVDAVQSAIKSPSGTVDATSVGLVLEGSQSIELYGSMQFINEIFGSQIDAKCLSGSGTDGSADVSCMTGGKATGQISFKGTVATSAASTDVTFEMTLSNVCQDGKCLDGSLAAAISVSEGSTKTTVQGSFDMTNGGVTKHGDWGTMVSTGQGTASAQIVTFDDAGNSYVLSASASVDGTGEVTIKGANGEFSCSYDGGGEKGSCTGAGTFKW